MGIPVSITLINIIGFSVSVAVIAFGVKSNYGESQMEESEENYIEEVSPTKQNITAEVLGLTVEIAKYGLESADRKIDVLFENRVSKWLRWKIIERFQVEPDGFYLKSRAEVAWEGYKTEQDVPVYRAGKFEMFI